MYVCMVFKHRSRVYLWNGSDGSVSMVCDVNSSTSQKHMSSPSYTPSSLSSSNNHHHHRHHAISSSSNKSITSISFCTSTDNNVIQSNYQDCGYKNDDDSTIPFRNERIEGRLRNEEMTRCDDHNEKENDEEEDMENDLYDNDDDELQSSSNPSSQSIIHEHSNLVSSFLCDGMGMERIDEDIDIWIENMVDDMIDL